VNHFLLRAKLLPEAYDDQKGAPRLAGRLSKNQQSVGSSADDEFGGAHALRQRRFALLPKDEKFCRRPSIQPRNRGCNNNPNFGLRFRWQVNTIGEQENLDNIVVTSN